MVEAVGDAPELLGIGELDSLIRGKYVPAGDVQRVIDVLDSTSPSRR
jgi:hypothetical protein